MGDRHPLGGHIAMHLEIEIVEVTALGHYQTEVEGRTAHDVRCALGSECPCVAAR